MPSLPPTPPPPSQLDYLVEAAETAITTEIGQLQAALDQLSTSQPPTQAQLDQLNLATSRLAAATTALHADDPTVPTP